MNKHGQSTAMFVILIPIFLLVLAFIYDNTLSLYEKTRFENITEDIAKEALKKDTENKEEIIKNLYKENKYETDMLYVSYENEELTVVNSHSYESFLGKILTQKEYKVEAKIKAYYENNEIVIKKIKEG